MIVILCLFLPGPSQTPPTTAGEQAQLGNTPCQTTWVPLKPALWINLKLGKEGAGAG